MTKMTETERRAWTTLFVDGTILALFIDKMTRFSEGMFQIKTISPGDMLGLFIGIVVITIILHAVIAGIFAARSTRKTAQKQTKRDIRIERTGSAFGFNILTVALNLLLLGLVAQYSAEHFKLNLIDFTNPSHLFFLIMSMSLFADVIKNLAMIVSYKFGK